MWLVGGGGEGVCCCDDVMKRECETSNFNKSAANTSVCIPSIAKSKRKKLPEAAKKNIRNVLNQM